MMPGVLVVIALVASVLALAVSTWALLTRRRILGVSVRPDSPVDVALKELLERSRANSGRVHIHDVEETLRRLLG